ncbi:Tuftelin-interacting protein TIP39, contains G-patch domain [Phaffia rhodozyma]|uniref:Tuftelin-interacting protein TIP39, contains G-patch domain n=1 Tax=Phaffia rhodozyma TaxID=264483 RepID=A0A0F7SWP4_PHARH|nr:Tuftelin-interacting protein TIP39, contains G-patch domain [Phaffia rhodozyma]
MARRKANKGFLSDGSSSEGLSDDDVDDRTFDQQGDDIEDGDLYARKKRKTGKIDALYGVFAESDDEDLNGRGGAGLGSNRGKSGRATDWTKAPTFTTASSSANPAPAQPPSSQSESVFHGLDIPAFVPVANAPTSAMSPPDEPEVDGKNNSTRGGSSQSDGSSSDEDDSDEEEESAAPETSTRPSFLITAFGASKAKGPQKSFLRKSSPPPKPNAQPLTREDAAAFKKMEGSFGARMLAKQGWQAGVGLGSDGTGIITPVTTKLRGRGMGIGAGGTERTEQSIREAIRKGDLPDPAIEAAAKKAAAKAKAAGKAPPSSDNHPSSSKRGQESWRHNKKVKIRVEHKSYEEILEEAGPGGQSAGVGVIIDATGATPREVSSLSALNLSGPTSEASKLPELRHNLRMICDMTKGDLDALAREGVAVREKRKWLIREDENLKVKLVEEANNISRLQQIHVVINEISGISKTLASTYEPSLAPFIPPFDRLLYEFPEEHSTYSLDEIVVGAVSPVFRRLVSQWQPLESSTELLASLRPWKKAFKFSDAEKEEDAKAVDVYGQARVRKLRKMVDLDVVMTPYESMMWNVWLPKVRSAINNDWQPTNAEPAVQLIKSWTPLLPLFMHDNILDQLILPKLNKSITEWKPRKGGASLQSIVFPWLPFLGKRIDQILEDAKRRIRGLLKGWKVEERVPEELPRWREVFTPNEWDSLILKYILPKLGASLRDDFRVNPRNQILTELENVLPWQGVLRPTMMAQLLESGFFPKWLDVLYIWLIQPKPNFDDITQWYSYWKSVFPESILALPEITSGFKSGLDLMNQAMALGSSAPTRLAKPIFPSHPSSDSRSKRLPSSTTAPTATVKPSSMETPSHVDEITFRSIAQDYVTQRDLIWVPTGRSDVNTGQVLFRISKDGRTGGVVCYVSEDAVYVHESSGDSAGVFKPVTLEEVVKRALK